MKIAINFDTVEKTMSCTLDTTELANVIGCSLMKSYGSSDYMAEIMTAAKDEENDVRYYNRIVASETPAGKELVLAGAVPSNIPGFVILPNKDIEAEITSFFGKK